MPLARCCPMLLSPQSSSMVKTSIRPTTTCLERNSSGPLCVELVCCWDLEAQTNCHKQRFKITHPSPTQASNRFFQETPTLFTASLCLDRRARTSIFTDSRSPLRVVGCSCKSLQNVNRILVCWTLPCDFIATKGQFWFQSGQRSLQTKTTLAKTLASP